MPIGKRLQSKTVGASYSQRSRHDLSQMLRHRISILATSQNLPFPCLHNSNFWRCHRSPTTKLYFHIRILFEETPRFISILHTVLILDVNGVNNRASLGPWALVPDAKKISLVLHVRMPSFSHNSGGLRYVVDMVVSGLIVYWDGSTDISSYAGLGLSANFALPDSIDPNNNGSNPTGFVPDKLIPQNLGFLSEN